MRNFAIGACIAVLTASLMGIGAIGAAWLVPATSAGPTPLVLPTFIVPTLDADTPIPSPLPKIVTPTPTVTPTPAPTETPDPYTYVVQQGDTYWGISQKVGINWEILALVNQVDGITQVLYPGQTINIPNQLIYPKPTVTNGKQIIVVIGQQKLYPFKDGYLANAPFLVSTGTPENPTVLGDFHIFQKLRYDDMSGGVVGVDHYYLPNVPFVMYFGNNVVSWHKGYGLHGTYWHHRFGEPMSHGCVNLRTDQAEWLYNWAVEGKTGTLVTIIN